jgi:O-acetyl-ADP-ribose deacetylase (regulator of RNase III)
LPFSIVRQDLTQMRVDAIVNAANPQFQMGGGVCGAIFRAAGEKALQAACDEIGGCETGQAVATPGFNLPAKLVIHTPGPRWQGGNHGEEALLRLCYRNSLRLAQARGAQSIAFPLISSGIYGYPKAKALRVATAEILEFLRDQDMDVYLALFDKEALADRRDFGGVQDYIDRHLEDTSKSLFERLSNLESEAPRACATKAGGAEADLDPDARFAPMAAPPAGLDRAIGSLDESFSEALLRLIDRSGRTDAEVYKRANIDRRLFSKIRTNRRYMPGKRTVLALAVALELELEEARGLLESAGYALSHSQKFDVIVEYFIQTRRFDVFEINETLFYYDQPLLGS